LAVKGLAATGASGEGQRDEIVNLIREFIAASDTAMLTEGIVGSSAVDEATEIFPGAHPSGLTTPPKVARPPALKVVSPKGAVPNRGPDPALAAQEVRAAERRQREQAERRARLQAKLAAAEEVLEAARQATREATANATAAKDAVAEALRQQVRAERHLATTRDRLDDAQVRVAAAARTLRDAETEPEQRR